jgi:hypothetical protein
MVQQQLNSTTTRVFFSNAGRETSSTFGTMQGNWTSDISGWLWRVRKSSAGAAVGFGIVSETSSGLMPSTNANLDNASSTRLGLKQYLHGTTYNGGNAPTVTLTAGGGTLSSVDRAVFVPYQMQDGTWRVRINIKVTTSATARTQIQLTTSGLTYSSTTQTISGVVGSATFAPYASYVAGSVVVVDFVNSSLQVFIVSGDVELASKPTWAY